MPRQIKTIRMAAVLACRRGIAAVEFAVVAPVLILMFLGSYVLNDAIGADRKITITARSMADLVTRSETLTAAEVDTILAASAKIMAPYPVANARLTISLVNVDADGKATIGWSRALNTTARTTGSSVVLQDDGVMPSTSVVLSEVRYTYTSAYIKDIIDTVTLVENIVMYPRRSPTIPLT